jgi:hypothetical protein
LSRRHKTRPLAPPPVRQPKQHADPPPRHTHAWCVTVCESPWAADQGSRRVRGGRCARRARCTSRAWEATALSIAQTAIRDLSPSSRRERPQATRELTPAVVCCGRALSAGPALDGCFCQRKRTPIGCKQWRRGCGQCRCSSRRHGCCWWRRHS